MHTKTKTGGCALAAALVMGMALTACYESPPEIGETTQAMHGMGTIVLQVTENGHPSGGRYHATRVGGGGEFVGDTGPRGLEVPVGTYTVSLAPTIADLAESLEHSFFDVVVAEHAVVPVEYDFCTVVLYPQVWQRGVNWTELSLAVQFERMGSEFRLSLRSRRRAVVGAGTFRAVATFGAETIERRTVNGAGRGGNLACGTRWAPRFVFR